MVGLSILASTVRAMSDGAKSRQEEIEDRRKWRTINRRITTLAITDNNGARRLFWFAEPEGSRPEEGRLPAGVTPFRTEAEVRKRIRAVNGIRIGTSRNDCD